MGPRNHALDGSPDPPYKKGSFEVGGRLSSIAILCALRWAVQNGWTNWDAVCVMDSGRLKESCIRWGPDHKWEGGILRRKGGPL